VELIHVGIEGSHKFDAKIFKNQSSAKIILFCVQEMSNPWKNQRIGKE
jgi:hypothetical protein